MQCAVNVVWSEQALMTEASYPVHPPSFGTCQDICAALGLVCVISPRSYVAVLFAEARAKVIEVTANMDEGGRHIVRLSSYIRYYQGLY